jgi:hypothetical protein
MNGEYGNETMESTEIERELTPQEVDAPRRPPVAGDVMRNKIIVAGRTP